MSLPASETFGLTIPAGVEEKFYDFVAKSQIRDPLNRPAPRSIDHYLIRSRPHRMDSELRAAISWVLRCRGEGLWVRLVQMTPTMRLAFIGDRQALVEIVSFRGLRQIVKAWLHDLKRLPVGVDQDRVQALALLKKPRPRRVGGGLIRQERCPRNRWTRESRRGVKR